MLKDHVKRDISDFLDGELPSEAQDKLFSDSETASENLEYLQTLRLIKRSEAELSEFSPEKLKSSVFAVVGKTVVLKRKANIFTAVWIALAVILAVAVAWAVFFPVYTPKKPEPKPTPSSAPAVASSDTSDVSSGSSEGGESGESSGLPSEGESSTVYDYSYYLPYGVDEFLPQEYRGAKYSYVVFAKGTYVATLMKTNPANYILGFNDPGETALLLCDKSLDDCLKDLGATWFKLNDVVTDETFDGISATSTVGIVFVRA